MEVSIDQQKIETLNLPPFLSDDLKNAVNYGQEVDAITAKKLFYDDLKQTFFQKNQQVFRNYLGMLCPLIDIMEKRQGISL